MSKSISGRKWKDGDSFKFTIAGSDPTQNAPLPNPDSVAIGTKTENHEASFGEIEYKTAGTYTYTVKETKPIAAIAGLHYSQAEYTVTVKVPTDMGTPTVSIKRVTDDNGKPGDNQSANVAKFTNTYVAVSALPLTGGMTDRQWLFVGGAVGGLAVRSSALPVYGTARSDSSESLCGVGTSANLKAFRPIIQDLRIAGASWVPASRDRRNK